MEVGQLRNILNELMTHGATLHTEVRIYDEHTQDMVPITCGCFEADDGEHGAIYLGTGSDEVDDSDDEGEDQ